ncbi:Nif3-like dinuclear metal center hexameric protein [Candidatus Epulonipiscium viviparus]|uniref:Nif3-like dinuclear metal center hexameric protein n=1 Tax=Candidatus Epulonipiscium viviparus TaxID=420336 RepID=UPI00016C0A4D|nr:Nif3-like dinuclear metal center hexameric protein [Candidatus Epulopiscium viviparus]
MYTIEKIMQVLEELAPLDLAEEWDNVGVLIGTNSKPVKKIMCALDLNEQIADEAIAASVDCIITHHPYIFTGLKKIDYATSIGKVIRKLIINDISLIAMHTNLDKTKDGINDIICKGLNVEIVNGDNFLRWGKINSITLKDFITKVKNFFDAPVIRVIGYSDKKIEAVSICSGSGAEFIKQAASVSDVYITGDLKFHEAQGAIAEELIVLDVGHYNSEKIIIPYLVDYLKTKLDIEVISTNICAEVFKTV